MKRVFIMMMLLLTGLTACERTQNNDPQLTARGVEIGNQYMDALKAGDLAAAFKFYSPEFFKTRSEEGWRDQLAEIAKKRGKLVRYEVSDQQMDMRYSGRFYIVIYRAWYENSQKSSSQIVTSVEPVTGDQRLKIYAHKINFDDVQVQ